MLELGRELHVAGDGGPAVLQDLHLRAAGVDHRLDGEEHALAQLHAGAGAAVVQHAGRIVKDLAEAVAAEVGHHREALRSEEHTSELQSLMRTSYAVFRLNKKK